MYTEEIYLSTSENFNYSQNELGYIYDESYSNDCENSFSVKMISGTKI